MTDQELAKALRRSGGRLLGYHNKLTSGVDRAEAMHLVKLVIEACERLEARARQGESQDA